VGVLEAFVLHKGFLGKNQDLYSDQPLKYHGVECRILINI
jgi:hypothetical protein